MSGNEVTGKAKGGIARRDALDPPRRAQIAKKAAQARWGAKATHKGNFKEEFGIEVECYVLDDETKTAVISQRGMGAALGFSEGGSRLPAFVKGTKIAPYVGRALAEKLENPIIFQSQAAGAGTPPTTTHGYDVTILIDLCKAIAKASAEKKLVKQQENIARQANIILGASAKAGIKELVYKLSGYESNREDYIAAFKLYVQEEARKYEPEFPTEIYMHWHRLYEIPIPARGKPWHFKYLTVRHIYHPLAKSSGKIFELLKALKADGGDTRKKLFQFLNIIGARALRIHLGRILEMAEDSKTREEYERRVRARFGDQLELDLLAPSDPIALPPPALQSLPDARAS